MALGSEQIAGVVGAKVIGLDGDRIGRVAEIHVNDRTGEPEWALVCSGRFGQASSLVPLAGADIDGAILGVPYEAATIWDAPRVEMIGPLSERQKRGLLRYYEAAASDRPSTSGRH